MSSDKGNGKQKSTGERSRKKNNSNKGEKPQCKTCGKWYDITTSIVLRTCHWEEARNGNQRSNKWVKKSSSSRQSKPKKEGASNKDTISVFSRPQCITRTTGLVVMNKSIILTRIKSSQPLQTGLQKAKKNVWNNNQASRLGVKQRRIQKDYNPRKLSRQQYCDWHYYHGQRSKWKKDDAAWCIFRLGLFTNNHPQIIY